MKKNMLSASLAGAVLTLGIFTLASCQPSTSSSGSSGGSSGTSTSSGSSGSTVETRWITIPAGTLQMKFEGSGFTSSGIYTVTLSNSIQMCDHEVTVGEWRTVMNCGESGLPYETRDKYSLGILAEDTPAYYSFPVLAHWADAVNYCNTLSSREGLTPAYTVSADGKVSWNKSANGYRLPTAAEWQYAARAGETATDSPVWSGTTNAGSLGEYAWYWDNSEFDFQYGPTNGEIHRGLRYHVVKGKKPNAWQLYDMTGNVAEWCWDYCQATYPNATVTDPSYDGFLTIANPLGGEPTVIDARVGAGHIYCGGDSISNQSNSSVTNCYLGVPTLSHGIRVVRGSYGSGS